VFDGEQEEALTRGLGRLMDRWAAALRQLGRRVRAGGRYDKESGAGQSLQARP
jgi:hypothetical protein